MIVVSLSDCWSTLITILICQVGNYYVNIKLKVLKKKSIMLCNYFDKESHTGITFISS